MRNKNKLAMRIMICALMMIVLAGSVFALGVSPGRTVIQYEPGKVKDISINIINNEKKDLRLLVYAEGDLSEYVSVDKKLIHINRNEEIKTFKLKVMMPWKLERAGTNEIKLKILEMPPDASLEGNATVKATLELVHQIKIEVPYPDMYLEVGDLYTTEPPGGDNVLFTLPVFNKGNEEISNITGLIEIYDPSGTLISFIETSSASLESQGSTKLEARFYHQDRRGKYKAVATVNYADKKIRVEKEFSIGGQFIDIKDVTVDRFKLGDIAKFNIIAESRWNQLIKDVFAEVYISDGNNNQLTKFKTASADMEAGSISILNAFWSTEGITPGRYSMRVVLNYLGLTSEKMYLMDVGLNDIKIKGNSATGSAVGGESVLKSPLLWVLVVIIALNVLIINIILFRYIRSKRQKME